jgi:hypothetical protein
MNAKETVYQEACRHSEEPSTALENSKVEVYVCIVIKNYLYTLLVCN